MANNWQIEDEKEGKKILIGILIAFVIAAIIAFFNYEPDFLLGKIIYSICIGMVWSLCILGILMSLNAEFRKKASISEKIIITSCIFYPLLYGLGWKFFDDGFFESHPCIHAYFALFIPATILLVVNFIAKIFDRNA